MEAITKQTEHTPGPWEWEVHDGSMMSLGQPNHTVSPGGRHVLTVTRCEACQKSGGHFSLCWWPKKEDADLIAAGPELLAALEAVILAIDAFPSGAAKSKPLGSPSGGIAKIVRAAIAKARGTE